MTAVTHDDDPLVVSSLMSVLVAATAVALVATASWQRVALLVVLAGVITAWAGIQLARRRTRPLGVLVGLVGGGIAMLGIVGVGLQGPSFSAQVELVPGLTGLVVLAVGLAPVRRGWARRCLAGGTALVLCSVVASGVVYGTEVIALLGATVATILAWDVGEQGINLAEHVGRQSRTVGVELSHGVVGAAVGTVAVAVALGLRGLDIGSLPFVGLVGLLVTAIALGLALSN